MSDVRWIKVDVKGEGPVVDVSSQVGLSASLLDETLDAVHKFI